MWDDNAWNDTIFAISDEVNEFYTNELAVSNRGEGYDGSTSSSSTQHQSTNSTFAQQPLDVQTTLLAIQYLHTHGGYNFEEIQSMHAIFPPLLEMDVLRHLRPKMRFLKDCLGGADAGGQGLNPQLKAILPANFFGSRLERTIAPRHAYLVHVGLPSGDAIWDGTHTPEGITRGRTSSLLEEFLLQHRKPKQFAAMCNKWRTLYGSKTGKRCDTDKLPITSEEIASFDNLFQRGILSAARDDSVYIQPGKDGKSTDNSPSLLQTADVTSAQLVRYLLQHGSNPWETE